MMSQMPWHNPEHQPLPKYFEEWSAIYDSGADVTRVFGEGSTTGQPVIDPDRTALQLDVGDRERRNALAARPRLETAHQVIDIGAAIGGTLDTAALTSFCGTSSCFVTTFRRNMENELPADTEQCPPRALVSTSPTAKGPDLATGFLAAI